MTSGQWMIVAIAGLIILIELAAAGKWKITPNLKTLAQMMFSGPQPSINNSSGSTVSGIEAGICALQPLTPGCPNGL